MVKFLFKTLLFILIPTLVAISITCHHCWPVGPETLLRCHQIVESLIIIFIGITALGAATLSQIINDRGWLYIINLLGASSIAGLATEILMCAQYMLRATKSLL